MLTTRANIHKSKLPNVGSLVRVKISLIIDPKRKFRVLAFPLCDNTPPYSIGIHTVWLQALDNGQTIRVSGFICEPINE